MPPHDGATLFLDRRVAPIPASCTGSPARTAHDLGYGALHAPSQHCRCGPAHERGVTVSLRTIEQAALRQSLAAEARATVRFETLPGRQLQIDFGETRVPIGEETVRVHLFVATLGYSRRLPTVPASAPVSVVCWIGSQLPPPRRNSTGRAVG